MEERCRRRFIACNDVVAAFFEVDDEVVSRADFPRPGHIIGVKDADFVGIFDFERPCVDFDVAPLKENVTVREGRLAMTVAAFEFGVCGLGRVGDFMAHDGWAIFLGGGGVMG